MRNRFVLTLCVFALASIAIGCGAASQANFGQPTSPTNPSNDPSASLQITTTQLPDASASVPYSAQLDASGGVAPYVWSLSGELPAGLTMSSSGVIAGTPSATGQSMLTLDVQDSEAQPQTAKVTLALDVANGVRAASTTTSIPTQFYGAGRGADSLANCTVGPYGFVIAYRFVAQHTAALTKVRFYIIPDHPGYAGGDAGSLKVAIETDDGTSAHNPSGTVIATGELASPLAVTGPARDFPLITFSSPANLTAGHIYHVLFTNTDPNPSVNFLSVDELYYKQATSPNQPTVSDMASSVLRLRNGSWQKVAGYSPIFQLFFSNGDYQGYGYVEAYVIAPEIISGSKEVRETFTVSGGSRSVSSLGIRLARVSGTGNLTVRLENSAGTLIEQGYVSASSFPAAGSDVWVRYNFASSKTLASGQSYHVVLEAPSSSEYEAYPLEKGTAYGFDKLTYFPDGYAQFNPGTGWVGWSIWGVNNRLDSDLQFYFGQ